MTISNSALLSESNLSPYSPQKGTVTISYFESGQFREVNFNYAVSLTVRELCNQPFVFRFDIPKQGRVYFVGVDEPYLKLKREGKEARWIHDLIEYWRQDLIMRGFPQKTSIYHWRIRDISILQKALMIFPGSQVEVRQ